MADDADTPMVARYRWYSRPIFITGIFFSLSLGTFHAAIQMETLRGRLVWLSYAAFFFVLANLWYWYGPLGIAYSVDMDADADVAEVDRLRAELDHLRAAGLTGGPMGNFPASAPPAGLPTCYQPFDGLAQGAGYDPAGSPLGAFSQFAQGLDPGGAMFGTVPMGAPPPPVPPGLHAPCAPSPSALTYSPLSPGATTPQLNATRMVLTHLDACYASRAGNPYWFMPFWTAVAFWDQGGLITPDVHGILAFHGFTRGAQPPQVTPRMPELAQHLNQLIQTPTAPTGAGPSTAFQNAAGSDGLRWDEALPPDFKRAGSEVYRSLRSQGCASVRDWLLANFGGDKSSHVWKDLWTLAQQADFQIAAANGQGGYAGVMQLLSSSDSLELALRRLASYKHQERTGDIRAAAHIQGTQPPGCKADIAPTWLVTESTSLSKNELQRDELLNSVKHRSTSSSKPPGTKGGGKGKKE